MKRKIQVPLIVMGLLLCFGCSNHKNVDHIFVARNNYEKFVSNHEFSNAPILNKKQLKGNYELEFDGSELTSGIYFYILQAGDFIKTKKMILLK